MTQSDTSTGLKTMNFIVGCALLIMLFPRSGSTPDKPAGVRTAIELIDKRGSKSFAVAAEIRVSAS